jgi:hypothetical protein
MKIKLSKSQWEKIGQKAGWTKIVTSSHSTSILDALDKTIPLVIDSGKWITTSKKALMPSGVLKEYAVIEFNASNVKFPNDQLFVKIFYEIWTGEYNGYGKGLPKNVPVFRGFVEGKRDTPWPSTENTGTHEDTFGQFAVLVDSASPERKEMARIGDFNKFIGEPIDVAKHIKSLIDKWGNDDNEDFDSINTSPVNSGILSPIEK